MTTAVVYRHHGNVAFCDDCGDKPPTVTFGLGAVRCDECAEVCKKAWRAESAARDRAEAEALKAHQDAGCPDDGISCPECCEHEFDWDEGYTCLNCGEQGDPY